MSLHHTMALNRLTPMRTFPDDRKIQVPEYGESHRSWYRRCRHDQVMSILPGPAQAGSLLDAEAMLLVDDHQAEPAEAHIILCQCLGSDDNINVMLLYPR